MNYRTTFTNTFRLFCTIGSVVVLGSIFWFASELYSSGYSNHPMPTELLAETAPAPTLPDGIAENESQSLDSRNLFAALNDTMYSSLNNYESSRLFAMAQPETSMADRSSPELLTAKVQCNLKTSASNLNGLNGVALNNKECL